MNHTLADLERLVAAAEVAEPGSASSAWAAAAKLAQEPDLARSAEGAYLLGYAHYQLGPASQGGLGRAAELLSAALARAPSHAYARLYLGHIAFDEGNFSDALVHFDKLEADTFSRNGQPWRDLKRQELRICCLLQLNQVEHLKEEFERLLELASGLDVSDTLAVHELPSLLQAKFCIGQNAA